MPLVRLSVDYVDAVVATTIYGRTREGLYYFQSFYAILPYFLLDASNHSDLLLFNLVKMTSQMGICPSNRST